MNDLLELLTYPFVYRALIAGSMIAVCASVLGVILVLKHYSLIGHGLSEIGFASLSVASALGLPVMMVSAPAVIAASFLIMYVSQRFRTAGDIAIAVVSSARPGLCGEQLPFRECAGCERWRHGDGCHVLVPGDGNICSPL